MTQMSLLTFAGGGTVDSVAIGDLSTTNATIKVDGGNGTVTGLALGGLGVMLDFMTNNTLTIDNENTLADGQIFYYKHK